MNSSQTFDILSSFRDIDQKKKKKSECKEDKSIRNFYGSQFSTLSVSNEPQS